MQASSGPPKLCFPTLLLAAESSAEAPQPRPSTPPSLFSTIRLCLPRAGNVLRTLWDLFPIPF